MRATCPAHFSRVGLRFLIMLVEEYNACSSALPFSNKLLKNAFVPELNVTIAGTTERGGSAVTHETRIREVPGSNPVAGQSG